MSKSEEQVLDELLSSQRSGCVGRTISMAFSSATLALLVVLSVLIMREIHLSEQEAYEAHRAERRVQNGLTAAHDVQAASAEQFLSFGNTGGPDPCQPRGNANVDLARCVAQIDRIIADALHGRFIGISDLRSLRVYAGQPTAAEESRALARAVLALTTLERWVVPMATQVQRFVHDPRYTDLLDLATTAGGGDPRWPLLRARVHTLALEVAATPVDRRPFCERILWERGGRIQTPADHSLHVLIWQAECLRKDPSLSDARLAIPSGAASDDAEAWRTRRTAALTEGRSAAEAYFQAAVDAIEAPVGGPSRAVCGIDLDASLSPGLRTYSEMAARAYNGLSMTLISRQPTEPTLEAARDAIDKAVCFRQEAQQTPAVQAGSQENLAVIAYRRAHLALRSGNEAAAWHAFKEARCEAERAVRDNPLLPWSWTILYITETALRSPWSEEQIDCDAMFGLDVQVKRRAIPAIWRKLTFFTPARFAPDELPSLLPLAESPSPFNETGYDTLEALLSAQAAEWARVEAREEDLWTEILGIPEQLGSLVRTGL